MAVDTQEVTQEIAPAPKPEIVGRDRLRERMEEMRRTQNIGYLAEGLRHSGIAEEEVRGVVGDLLSSYKKNIKIPDSSVGLASTDSLDLDSQSKLATVREALVKLWKENPSKVNLPSPDRIVELMNTLALYYGSERPESGESLLPKQNEIKGNEKDTRFYVGEKATLVHFTKDNFDTLSAHLRDNLFDLKNDKDPKSKNINDIITDSVTPRDFQDFIADSSPRNAIEQARNEGRLSKEQADYFLKLKNLYRNLADQGINFSALPEYQKEGKARVMGEMANESYREGMSAGRPNRTMFLLDDSRLENILIDTELASELGAGQIGRAIVRPRS